MTQLLTVKEVAERFDVTTRAVYKWIRRGYLPGTHRLSPAPNSPYRIPESAIDAFLKRRERQAVGDQDES